LKNARRTKGQGSQRHFSRYEVRRRVGMQIGSQVIALDPIGKATVRPRSHTMPRSGSGVVEPVDGGVTELLEQAAGGSAGAQDRLFQLLLPTLRQMAAARMARENPGHTLSPTAIVNEAFLRIAKQYKLPAENTAQFLGVFGLTMRRVLVDHWKKKNAAKGGGGADRVSLDDSLPLRQQDTEKLYAVHQCLEKLERVRPRPAKIVEHRFFGGLENHEIAKLMGISISTVEADWRFARAWLRQELGDLGGR
jgi:RNA polymerase sigma-70 factor (ECF subfamily)